jgi:hypothetical protein
MIIRYSNGQTLEAVLLSRTETTMRIVPEGHDDVVELTRINGLWVSDDCEAVQVNFVWNPRAASTDVKEEDCICSHEMAERLIKALYGGEGECRSAGGAAVLWIGRGGVGSLSDCAIPLI